MSQKDCNRQVVKRQKIRKATLIIGVDIGKAFNAAGFMDKEGNVLGSCAKRYNSREGFEEFINLIEGLKAKHHLRAVLIGMEPTGHYWRKLASFAKDHGYEVRFMRTTALKHHREIDESSSAKSDRRDALTIANITREGKYIDAVIEDGPLRQLRQGMCLEEVKRTVLTLKNIDIQLKRTLKEIPIRNSGVFIDIRPIVCCSVYQNPDKYGVYLTAL